MKKIIHIDADCFYAAVEMRENSRLRDMPIAVGGDPGQRGVIATCNYEARRYGVRSAMASAYALRQCPQLKIFKPNMNLYSDVSREMRDIFMDYTDKIEPLSLDEAYLDVSDSELCRGSATLVAQDIQRRVSERLGITVSAGVAPVKFLAKIASDWLKPAGFYAITPNDVEAFMTDLPVEKLPGVGKVTANKLHRFGFYTCADLQACGFEEMAYHFGAMGEYLWHMAFGRDDRPVEPARIRKTISIETTYADDMPGASYLGVAVPPLLEGLSTRFDKIASMYSASKRFVKIKFSDFTQTTLEAPLSNHSHWCDKEEFTRLLQAAWHRHRQPVRLLGLGLHLRDQAVEPTQLPLFDRQSEACTSAFVDLTANH